LRGKFASPRRIIEIAVFIERILPQLSLSITQVSRCL
jgi:hypothetical protein